MKRNLYIITGTTSGLGKEIEKIFIEKSVDHISINRGTVDLSNSTEVEHATKNLRKKISKKYNEHKIVFINNAATIGPIVPMRFQTTKQILDVINVNFIAPLLFLGEFVKMKNEWAIFNITSGAANSYNKYLGLYSTTKLAYENYLKFVELEKEENNCQAIYNYDPGIIQTSIHKKLKNSEFFKNKKFEKSTPRDVIMVATEVYNLLEDITNDNKRVG